MTLEAWKRMRVIRSVPVTPADVRNQIAAAEQDLAQAALTSLAPSWRLAIAYESARKFAAAALAAIGYRVASGAGHHRYTVQSLLYTARLAPETVQLLDAFRVKRNDIAYDSFAPPGEGEAAEMLDLAHRIRDEVTSWLRREHPSLLA